MQTRNQNQNPDPEANPNANPDSNSKPEGFQGVQVEIGSWLGAEVVESRLVISIPH